jgi:hypothetical protein
MAIQKMWLSTPCREFETVGGGIGFMVGGHVEINGFSVPTLPFKGNCFARDLLGE